MPSIEIYGYTDWVPPQLVAAIWRVVEALTLQDDSRLTIVRSQTRRYDGTSAPFIRIVSTSAYEAEQIKTALTHELEKEDQPSIDIDPIVVHHFFQA